MTRLPRYRVFGLTLESGHRFRSRLAAGGGAADFVYRQRPAALRARGWHGLRPLYESPNRHAYDEGFPELYRRLGAELLRFSGIAEFQLRPGAIDVYPLREGAGPWIEIQLLGAVLAYTLESRGVLALHASAIEIGGRAVAFLSRTGGGKTSLAAAALLRGRPLVTDDLLAVDERPEGVFVHAGYPQLRLWPEEAERFLPRREGLERLCPGVEKLRVPVGPGGLGSFRSASLPLGAVYLLERRPPEAGEGIAIEPVAPRQALIELLRHSFTPYIVEATGLHPRRLDRLARLLARVPVHRLAYPAGFERLPEVVEAVARALR